ncbi:MAG: hypothetical protein P4M15_12710 [Alphaproteobacteria bacterium]|nr:hypothetical protein [Alphaproteobacteria bacterium]
MDDQGEKIVFLAREILKAGAPALPADRKAVQITMTFKTLCFTTLLAAAGGFGVTSYMQADERPLNRYEKTEIDALLFYAAKVKGVDEENLRRTMEQEIGIARTDQMTAADFPAARKFLQEHAQ